MERRTNLDYLIKVAILGAIAGAIMLLKIQIPIFPWFLTLDFSDIPAVVGGLVFGPLAGVLIMGIKIVSNLLFQGSLTFGIGELANFASGVAFVLPLALIYKKYGSFKSVIVGSILGTLSITGVMCLTNYYFFLPMYAKLYYLDFVEIGSALPWVGKYVNSMVDVIIFNFIPFNILKGVSVSLITLLTYKFIIPPLKRIQNGR